MEDEPHGVHDFVYDPRNADVLISINGELKHRDEATVSVFDSGYLLGDGVWEGLRVKDGAVAFLDEHLKRLYAGAKTIDMDIGLTKDELTTRLFDCLKAQDMTDGVHIRLMVTRGIKKTPYQGPRFTITKPTIVIIPEYKAPEPEVIEKGLSLFTVHVRRTGPAEQDQKLNCILACIQADKAGADEGLMLDADGFVVTGTFAGVTPVREVDGRTIEHVGGPMAQKITRLYQDLVKRSLTPIK